MDRDDRIIYLHFKGESVRDLSTQFDLPYAKVYQIVNSAKDEMAELRAKVSILDNQVERLKKLLSTEVDEVMGQLEQSKLDNIKLLVRLHRLKKKVEFLENKLDGFNQQEERINKLRLKNKLLENELSDLNQQRKAELKRFREENNQMLCRESKILAWQAWKEKV